MSLTPGTAMPDLTPLTPEELAALQSRCDRATESRTYAHLTSWELRCLLAQVAAAEQEVAALRDLVQGLVTHAEIAVNSSEWYGPADRTRAESLVEAAKAHLRGGADPPAGGGA